MVTSSINTRNKQIIRHISPEDYDEIKRLKHEFQMSLRHRFSNDQIDVFVNIPSPEFPNPVTRMQLVEHTVCQAFNITPAMLHCKSRRNNKDQGYLVDARRAFCMLILHDYRINISLKNLGLHLGGRDHSSIVHLRDSGWDLLESDRIFREKFIQLADHLNILIYDNKKN